MDFLLLVEVEKVLLLVAIYKGFGSYDECVERFASRQEVMLIEKMGNYLDMSGDLKALLNKQLLITPSTNLVDKLVKMEVIRHDYPIVVNKVETKIETHVLL